MISSGVQIPLAEYGLNVTLDLVTFTASLKDTNKNNNESSLERFAENKGGAY
jgi:hypothetical protein